MRHCEDTRAAAPALVRSGRSGALLTVLKAATDERGNEAQRCERGRFRYDVERLRPDQLLPLGTSNLALTPVVADGPITAASLVGGRKGSVHVSEECKSPI